MIRIKRRGVKYTGNNETKKNGRPYLISSSYEINFIANSMERRLGLRYTTLLTNCHRYTNGDNAVCLSTVYLAYKRLQPRITKIQKIQQGTKNEGKMERGKVSTSEAMVDHAQQNSRGERVSAKTKN